MNTKRTIRKILIVTMWLAIGSGMVTLLAAAMRQQKSERCSDYIITINGAEQNLFVDKQDIIKIIGIKESDIKSKPRSSFDLMKMEQQLENNIWVKDAELYFDNKEVLHVTVTEREPIARIFTLGDKTWYIDGDEKSIPLSDKMSANVPVFTGFPVKKVVSSRDKELLHQVRVIADYILANPFWMAQVAQIDITPERQFELVPAVGNHIVKLGSAEDIEKKFNRLFIFYKQVLGKTGLDKYRTIDVQYAGQVVGTKGITSKVDSIELRKSVERLLEAARNAQNDTLIPVAPVIARPSIEASTENVIESDSLATTLNRPTPPERQAVGPNPVKANLPPRAVMPRRN